MQAIAGVGVAHEAPESPPGEMAAALEYLNARYRRPLGLPDASWNALLAQAAQNHAQYLEQNPDYETNLHHETPGRPGFTGEHPYQRCKAVGALGCGEVWFPGLGIDDAIKGWMATPYHGAPLLWSSELGCGMSMGNYINSGCNFYGEVDVDTSNPEADVNAPGSALRVWPFQGAVDVPIRWWGGEIPDPLANYAGDRWDVGPVMFFFNGQGADLTIALEGTSGEAIPLLLPEGTNVEQTITIRPSERDWIWYPVFAGRILTGHSNYTISISGGGTEKILYFRTAGRENSIYLFRSSNERGVKFEVVSQAPDPILTLEGPSGRNVVRLSPEEHKYVSDRLSLEPGNWRACASSGGDNSEFTAASQCKDFRYAAFLLTVSMDGGGSGTIVSHPPGIDCGSVCSAQFTADQEIFLDAIPEQGSEFVGWDGACSPKDTSCVLILDSDTSVTAVFEKLENDTGVTCRGRPATLVGDAGKNKLVGTGAGDVIVGLGGDDEIEGGGGNDLICAGRGADVIRGGEGNDSIDGSDGSDEIDAGVGDDSVAGRGGADVIYGRAGRDRLVGGAGHDTIDGGGEEDVVVGEIGGDWLVGGRGADRLHGGRGQDYLTGGPDPDSLYAGPGYDYCFINSSDLTLNCEVHDGGAANS